MPSNLQRATVADLRTAIDTDGTATDPYRLVASRMYNVPYAQVTAQQRQAAKQATYVDIYGGSTHWRRA